MLLTSVALVIVTALYMRDNREYLTMLRETITPVIALDLGSQDGFVKVGVRNAGKSSVLAKLEYVDLYQYVAEFDKPPHQYVPYHHVARYGTHACGPFLVAPGAIMAYKIDEEFAYSPDFPYVVSTETCGIGLLDLVKQTWLYIHDPTQVSVDRVQANRFLWDVYTSPMDHARLDVVLEVSVFRQTVAATEAAVRAYTYTFTYEGDSPTIDQYKLLRVSVQ